MRSSDFTLAAFSVSISLSSPLPSPSGFSSPLPSSSLPFPLLPPLLSVLRMDHVIRGSPKGQGLHLYPAEEENKTSVSYKNLLVLVWVV